MLIGILQAETLSASVNERFGGYGEMFIRLLSPLSPQLQFRIYAVDQNEFPDSLDACDAYIITGSRFSAFDEEAWITKLVEFVRELDAARKKACLGICFGHQLIAHALGGRVERCERGWGIGVAQFQIDASLTETGEPLERELASKRDFRILVTHQDQVSRLPPHAKLLAHNHFCPIGAFQIGEHILCFQGHPEFSKDYLSFLIDKRRHHIDKDLVAKALNSLALNPDTYFLTGWIARFLSLPTASF